MGDDRRVSFNGVLIVMFAAGKQMPRWMGQLCSSRSGAWAARARVVARRIVPDAFSTASDGGAADGRTGRSTGAMAGPLLHWLLPGICMHMAVPVDEGVVCLCMRAG